ncbi:MAG: MotA/TolQ/ExbB proton channel family protein [Spirochaetes bacterium]|nr:MAG: MotA/TolQ/ExbB proton channel family protein [Spirochaetota bacterium]RKX89963.1 MAG: MotA/TolQ/ExbB proton channel family protein [Spirochaetota bacterium]RKX98568.1 MAG: MotA/TolQ/ExbB proton channel family protein [Spirochaetota bacterium]
MLDLIVKGGVVLWVIMLLSVIAVVIIIERYMYFRNIRTDEEKLFLRVKSAIAKGHYDEAMAICDASPSPFSTLLKTGIEHRNRSSFERKEVLKDTAAQEVPRLEKNIGTLGTIAHIAPLLGLLGTVTGNIKAFGVLGRFGSVGDPSILAKGISEALITTAAGLIVAIPATIFFNALTGRVNTLIVRMENQVNEMTLLLEEGEAGK